MTFIAAEIAALFTADITPHEKAIRTVTAANKALDGKTTTTKVDADIRTALASLDRLESRARSSDSVVPVDADTSEAEAKIDGLADTAAAAGDGGGKAAGAGLTAGIIGALATIPIAGALVGIAKAAGDAVVQGFQDGLAVEVRADRLAASTGLDEATVARLGAAAGESYADNFGESIDTNLDTARRAVQSGLLDPKSTQRDAEQVISSLSGVADVLEEDVSRVSRSTSQLLRTGLAKNAQEAFDIIVAGQQAGLNVSEDWLDVIDEYGTQWRKLGLEAGDVLGLLSQGQQAGARDTDIVADALKELSIRAIDGSKLTKEGFDAIGLSAEGMGAKFADGGDSAREALGDTLDALRKIEDPAKRDAAAVALFGTQAEDLGKALFALDLDTAAGQFDDLNGAADRALTTLGDNGAGKVESAQRSIEVAADGIKGALAEAFGDDLDDFAEDVSQNREAVVQFLLDLSNGAIDAGRTLVEAAAAGTEGFGDFVGTTGPAVLGLIESILEGIDSIPFVDLGGAVDDFKAMREEAEASFAEFDAGSEEAADAIRTNLIQNGIDPAQEKLNSLGEGMLNNAALSDATNRLADDIAEVGYAADGSKVEIELLKGEFDTSTSVGKRLDEQVRAVAQSLRDQAGAAATNGESQKEVRARVEQARAAFIDQMTAMGLNAAQAEKLADKYGLIPKKISTQATLDAAAALSTVATLDNSLRQLDGRTVTAAVVMRRMGQVEMAGGGAVHGPGTGTSDDVDAKLSNGEHVLTASDVQKAGGQGAIYRWRNAIQSGIARFAGGGAVESQSKRVARARDRYDDARDDARRARTDAQERRAERALRKASDDLDRERDKLARLREQTREAGTSLRRGEYGGDLGTVDELLDQSRNQDLSRFARRNLANTGRESERALARLDRTAASLEKRLTGARDKMADLRSISDNVSSGLIGEFSLSRAAGSDPSASGIVATLRATAQRIAAFGKKLKELAKAGLKGRALDEVAELGSVQGALVADELLADRRQLSELNSAYKALDAAGSMAGQAVTEGYYKGGLAQAEGYVKGLEKQQASLDKQYDRIGDRMAKAIAKALGIKARAGGGPVKAGSPYLVNEDTPNSELFVPDASGTILNRSQMRSLAGAQGAATAVFTDAQVSRLEAALERGAARGLAGHEAAQDRVSRYARGIN